MPQDNTVSYHALRQKIKAQRKQLSDEAISTKSKQLTNNIRQWLESHLNPADKLNIALFWPIKKEPSLLNLAYELNHQGHQLALPVVVKQAHPLKFLIWNPLEQLVPGYYNIPEPASTNPAIQPDLIFVPVLAYSLQGDRLGYGAGFYDRTIDHFQKNKHFPYLIGISWDFALLPPDYQATKYDQALDLIITEKRSIQLHAYKQ